MGNRFYFFCFVWYFIFFLCNLVMFIALFLRLKCPCCVLLQCLDQSHLVRTSLFSSSAVGPVPLLLHFVDCNGGGKHFSIAAVHPFVQKRKVMMDSFPFDKRKGGWLAEGKEGEAGGAWWHGSGGFCNAISWARAIQLKRRRRRRRMNHNGLHGADIIIIGKLQ